MKKTYWLCAALSAVSLFAPLTLTASSFAVKTGEAPKTWEKTAASELESCLFRRLGDESFSVGGVKIVAFHVGDTALAKQACDVFVRARFADGCAWIDRVVLKDRKEDGVAYVAHQGEERLAPSHSLPAYRFAVEHALDYLKLDIQRTKDGQIVLQHDRTLNRMMGWDEDISKLTLAEIREKGRYKPRGGFTNETIVTLDEALTVARGMRQGVWIDFKRFRGSIVRTVFAKLKEHGFGDDRVMVATWDKEALAWVRKHYPGVRCVAHTYVRKEQGGLVTNVGIRPPPVCADEKELVELLDAHGKKLGLYGFNLPAGKGGDSFSTSREMIDELHRRGYWVAIWYVGDLRKGARYRSFGADAFVTACKADTFEKEGC